MKWIDRFSNRFPRFGIPNLMLYIVALNALIFILTLFPQGSVIYAGLLFDRSLILQGQVWRVITCLLIPETTSPIFIIFTLYFYYLIGSSLEREWGTSKFTLYVLIGAVLTLAVNFIFDISASCFYLNLSLFFAFATFYPDFQVLIFFIIPIKIKWLAVLDAAYFVFCICILGWPYLLVPIVAVGNYFLFFFGDYVEYFKRNRSFSKSRSTFKQKVRESESTRKYRHKCSVCGITDVDDPEMEFRYCSLCTGYKCYCSKHIFNHTHS